ncbi:MAG TPA: helix-turn-helix transcriptional regulator [Candidatus Baltobacteraceae bacterium]|jgi:transcriptional regulator with XRE-family HTH domain|nr:helix-turn-helix transcriptional regulator [Candidatus Baltobacteraceae bacterium]
MSGTDRLQYFRLRKGITQDEAAEELIRLAAAAGLEVRVDASMISKWEHGKKRPRRHYRRLLCHLYQATEEELGFKKRIRIPPSILAQDQANPAERNLFSLTTPEAIATLQQLTASDISSRRDALMAMSAITGTLLLGPISQWIGTIPPETAGFQSAHSDMDEVANLEEMVRLFFKWSVQTGAQMRKAVIRQVQAVGERLEETPPGPVKTRMFEVAAQIAHRAGWMSYDSHLYGVAQRYYLLALRFSREADNRLISAKVISDMSHLATAAGNHHEALELLTNSLTILPVRQQGFVKADLLGLLASTQAQLGHSSDACRSIEASLEASANAVHESLPPVYDYLNSAVIHGWATTTYVNLARQGGPHDSRSAYVAQAERHAIAGFEGRDAHLISSRALDTIRLMNVRLLQGEPREAVQLGNSVMELARGVRSSRIVGRLADFQRNAQGRYPDLPELKEFQDHLRSNMMRSRETGFSSVA